MNLSEIRPIIKTDVDEAVNNLLSSNVRPISKSVVTEAIVKKWFDIEGEPGDRWLCAAHDSIQRAVGQAMNSEKAAEETSEDSQLVMEGFERLQKRYVIEREGERQYVLTTELSDEELAEKAEEHRRLGRGNFQHADEIERYIEERRAGMIA